MSKKHCQKYIFAQYKYFEHIRLFDYTKIKTKAGKGYLVYVLNKTLYLSTVHILKVPKPRVERLSIFRAVLEGYYEHIIYIE